LTASRLTLLRSYSWNSYAFKIS